MPDTLRLTCGERLTRPGAVATGAGRALVSGLLLVTLAIPALATEDVSLADYVLTSWTTKDGLPSDVIWSVTQDRDGYLWLGTNGGLVRFDGVRFATVESAFGTALPHAPVRSVYAGPDGTLWLGFSEMGGVSRIAGQHATNYGEADGLPRAMVTAIVQDPRGRVWAGTTRGLFQLTRERWRAIGPAEGLPEVRIDSLYVDRSGSLLVGTSVGVYSQPPDGRSFRVVDEMNDVASTFRGFGEDAAGALWVTDPLVAFRRLGEAMPAVRTPERGRGNRLIFDRERYLWVATMDEGLWRIRLDAAGQRGAVEKIRMSGARTLFEDHDGNIWTGAGDGLIRLRKPRVTPVTHQGLVEAVASTGDGIVWAATADGVLPFRHNMRDEKIQPLLRPGARVRAMRTDAKGTLWLITDAGLLQLRDGRSQWFRISNGLPRLNGVSAIAPAGDDTLWISDRAHGLFHWDPRRPDTMEPVPQLAHVGLSSIFTDRQGRLWFASVDGRLGMIHGNSVRFFGPQEGLSSGPHLTVFEDSRHVIWIGSFSGLSWFDGERFARFPQMRGFRGGVSSILEDTDHDLWLATASGIVCARRTDLDAALADPSHMVNMSLFDAADGLAGMPISFGGPSALLAGDGRLWFVTGRGLTSLNPRLLKQPRRPAQVRIESVLADEQPLASSAGMTLPARTSRLQIDYSVLDLSRPMGIRFKYRLEGFDADWIDAGTRRQALYSHLPPRSYRFHIVASTMDGSWSDTSTTWAFSIRPAFYQTYWFAAVCAVAIAFGTWSAWQLRVRRIRRQFALLIGERVRLSRELHDTLLQSLVGVALQFDAVSSRLEPAAPARQQLIRMRKQVEEDIREARQSIWNLRTPRLEKRDLATALRESAERAAAGMPVGLEFSLHGVPDAPSPTTDEQLLRICHEAVRNAVRHARANVIKVELRCDPDATVLRVADDGQGFDPARMDASGIGGHYGLVSMRERAEQVGGAFTLTTAAHAGTIIEARVPTCAST
ncbi:MAG TPA: two-component regulator propeller domain-containing protein [Vicinamibacterales bacterium]|nr:two-component regulator propeller domain-containing protein [Vicinamibacterales bacterium]